MRKILFAVSTALFVAAACSAPTVAAAPGQPLPREVARATAYVQAELSSGRAACMMVRVERNPHDVVVSLC